MPTAPVLIYSDPHYHNFAAFSGLHNGINTRLLSTIRATEEAVAALQAAGGHKIICAGDMFHVRGQITPSVMNPVINMIEHFPHDTHFSVIAGNHDLEAERTSETMSSITALGGFEMPGGSYPRVISKPFQESVSLLFCGNTIVALIPWEPDLNKLRDFIKNPGKYSSHIKAILDGTARPGATRYALVLHAPMNGVISGLPDHGLTVADFADTIWHDVFIGHYHNHKVFEDGEGRRIYSVGALTHQNWGDTESKAGYLLYYPDTGEVKQFETSAPKFIKVEIEDLDTIDVTGNFIKVIGGSTPEDAAEIRSDLLLAGALGATVEIVARKPAVTRGGATTTAPTIHSILQEYVERTYPGDTEVQQEAMDILKEVYE